MRKLLIISLILSALTLRAQNRISIEEYRLAVVDYSHALRIARATTLAADEQAALSRTGLLPRLDAAGRFDVALRQHAGVKPFSFSVQPLVVQAIYAGGARRATYERDRVGADAALCDEFFTQVEVIYAADDAYWNLAAARDRLRITEQYVAIIRSLKRVVDARFENGYISRSDVLMTDTRLSEAEYGLVAAEQAYQVALHNFNVLMGVEQAAGNVPADSVMTAVEMPARMVLDEILDRRGDFLASQLRVEQSLIGIRLARSSYLPQVSAGIGAVWQTRSPNTKWHTTIDGSVNLSVDVPIFHWGARRRSEGVARQQLAVREQEHAQLRDQIIRDETDAWSSIENSLSQSLASRRNLDIARENLELSTYSYNEGQLTILDVLSAQLSWLQVYENALEAALNLHLSVAEYRCVTSLE
ncbi:MAG: TolC family protein [Rikenellaceae bacterium]|nr:TolC family protein [Rikenellaceae bacterium]